MYLFYAGIFPVNVDDTHWNTVVMHIPKHEFQVLDSKYNLTHIIGTVEALVLSTLVLQNWAYSIFAWSLTFCYFVESTDCK